jgi:hypothetical protein
LDPSTGLWIRIRILLFSSVALRCQKKQGIFASFFPFISYSSTFSAVFKDYKSSRSDKRVEIKVFLFFLVVDEFIQIPRSGFVRIVTVSDPDPGSPKLTDP